MNMRSPDLIPGSSAEAVGVALLRNNRSMTPSSRECHSTAFWAEYAQDSLGVLVKDQDIRQGRFSVSGALAST